MLLGTVALGLYFSACGLEQVINNSPALSAVTSALGGAGLELAAQSPAFSIIVRTLGAVGIVTGALGSAAYEFNPLERRARRAQRAAPNIMSVSWRH